MNIEKRLTTNTNRHNRQVENPNLQWKKIIDNLIREYSEPETTLIYIEYVVSFRGFKKSLNQNYFSSSLKVEFSEFNFGISLNGDIQNQKLFIYDNSISKKDRDLIIKTLVDKLLSQMKFATGLQK
jgi:hypothetical protein